MTDLAAYALYSLLYIAGAITGYAGLCLWELFATERRARRRARDL